LRIFVEELAKENHSTLILGAPLLRAETHARVERGLIEEFDRIATRTYNDIETKIVDPRVEEMATHEAIGKHGLVVLTDKLRSLIEHSSASKQSVFLVAARKGLSPVTACGDCGTLIRCPQCDSPLVIHKKKPPVGAKNPEQIDLHVFACHSCGFMRSPENNVHETCPQCGGWKLQGLGIGIDRIEEELKKYFPDVPRFILDGDRIKTRTQLKKLILEFSKTPGSILIGTPMAVPYLDTVASTAIVSVDSLFAIPDIRMSERIFALVLALREKTTESLLIQTRADDTTIFSQALAGELMLFIKNELALRKTFSYPPFGTIIKITLRDKRNVVAEEIERLKVFLEDYSPIAPSSMSKEPKDIYRMHVILKLEEDTWPNGALLQKLRALPAQFTVEVNPNNLL
jgi:primosomal protein N' (replication factor Y)